jgi:hypothetical protein
MTTTLDRTETTTLCAYDDNDESGVCHVLGDDHRPICGGAVASDSPGLHRADSRSNPCAGCGRPRCPDCDALL